MDLVNMHECIQTGIDNEIFFSFFFVLFCLFVLVVAFQCVLRSANIQYSGSKDYEFESRFR